MNDKKICFIACVNDEDFFSECLLYISRLHVPEGYEIESLPKKVVVEKPFGKFTFDILKEEDKVHVKYSLLMKSGSYEKAKFQELSEFIKQVSGAYGQKMVLKKK